MSSCCTVVRKTCFLKKEYRPHAKHRDDAASPPPVGCGRYDSSADNDACSLQWHSCAVLVIGGSTRTGTERVYPYVHSHSHDHGNGLYLQDPCHCEGRPHGGRL